MRKLIFKVEIECENYDGESRDLGEEFKEILKESVMDEGECWCEIEMFEVSLESNEEFD